MAAAFAIPVAACGSGRSLPRPLPLPETWSLAADSSLNGAVWDDQGRPVGAAVVRLRPPGGGPERQALAAADGSFRIVRVPEGRYIVHVWRIGVITATDTVTVAGFSRDVVRLVVRQAPVDIQF